MRRRYLEKALRVLIHGDVDHLQRAKRPKAAKVHAAAAGWRCAKGIQGFGIGERVTKGKKQRDLVLKVYVERKRERSGLEQPVPRYVRLPGVPGRVRTDVEAIGKLTLQSFTAWERPAAPGVGLAHPAAPPGTFGCLVRRRGEPQLYLLSNSHVIADSGLAEPGDPIMQPAGGGRNQVIATLEAFVPLFPSSEGFLNQVDAAIGRVIDPAAVRPAIKQIGMPTGVSTQLRPNMLVQKTGSASEHTRGTVRAINFTAELPYKVPGGRVRRVGFRDQVLCTPFTKGGDSGALVLDMNGSAVGLHFAGSSRASVFNRIDLVLDALGLELVT